MVVTEVTKVRALNPEEIDCVAGGTDIPSQTGLWDEIIPIIVPGWKSPWWSPDDNPIPGTVSGD